MGKSARITAAASAARGCVLVRISSILASRPCGEQQCEQRRTVSPLLLSSYSPVRASPVKRQCPSRVRIEATVPSVLRRI